GPAVPGQRGGQPGRGALPVDPPRCGEVPGSPGRSAPAAGPAEGPPGSGDGPAGRPGPHEPVGATGGPHGLAGYGGCGDPLGRGGAGTPGGHQPGSTGLTPRKFAWKGRTGTSSHFCIWRRPEDGRGGGEPRWRGRRGWRNGSGPCSNG